VGTPFDAYEGFRRSCDAAPAAPPAIATDTVAGEVGLGFKSRIFSCDADRTAKARSPAGTPSTAISLAAPAMKREASHTPQKFASTVLVPFTSPYPAAFALPGSPFHE